MDFLMPKNLGPQSCSGRRVIVVALCVTAVLLTGPVASAQGVAVSDDFSGLSLNESLWNYIDPVGDGSVYQANGVLTFFVPGYTEHDLWVKGNDALRVMQPVTDTDLGVEVKFESIPGSRFQIQGLILEDSPGNYIRADFVHNGSELRLFGASFVGNSVTVHGDKAVSTAESLWLRVVRTGDTFTVTWSNDGTLWQNGFSFDHALTLNTVGVFGGNAGIPAPAFDVVVDYFFDTAAPIDPEDDGLVDIWPPLVGDIIVFPDPDSGTATVSCTTNEPATTLLSFGLDENYGTDVVGTSNDSINHQFLLTGLTPDVVVHFAIEATDALSNVGSTVDQQFLNEAVDPLEITVWGGLDQRVGHLGTAQADFNLMGNVPLWDILSSMDYSVNGGPSVPLNWGRLGNGFGDARRLARNGDFNVDVPLSQLLSGPNTIAVNAVDIHGREETVEATVTLESGSSDLPLSISWDTVPDPQDVGQNVDGNWTHDAQGLRTISTGYDRIFLLGEETWQDYEIVCPITIHEVLSETSAFSGPPGIGFLMRFTGHIVGGHRNWPEAQPKWGYQPFGSIGWLRYIDGPTSPPTVQFYHGDYDFTRDYGSAKAAGPEFDPTISPEATLFGDQAMVSDFGKANSITIGETFWMKMRCETLPDAPDGDGVTRYSYKMWENAETEPETWAYQVEQESRFALRAGGPCLLAHNVDVTFGDVSVFELVGNEPPTAVDDILSVVVGSGGDVDVVANDIDSDGTIDATTVAVIDQPLNGSITGVDPVTGVVSYLHDGGVAVADSFTYTVADDSGETSGPAMVRVEILASEPPTAVDDILSVVVGSGGDVDVVANDIDSDGTIDATTVAVVDQPLNGWIINVDPNSGVVLYFHDGGVAVADSFTYTVADDSGEMSGLAMVRVEILASEPPTAVDDILSVVVGSGGDVDVVANDIDNDGTIDATTVAVIDQPLNGSITGVDPISGVVSYLHDGGVAVADSFTYTVADDSGETSGPAMVRVTIDPIPAEIFVSDDFNSCELNSIWNFYDPQGDSEPATILGSFSGNAQVAIDVPPGVSHKLYDGEIGAPYIIQSSSDEDFTLEVKFDSVLPTESYAQQGIVVRQDDTNWIRLEFYSIDTDNLGIMAGLPDNSTPIDEVIPGLPANSSPLYMRIQRVGDDWTQSYATDGQNWTALTTFSYALNVTGVGLYGGNEGSNPAHTVLVDYFSNSLFPIVEPDDTDQNTLTTNVIGQGLIERDPDLFNYSCGDTVQLTATPAEGWLFDTWSGDLSGSDNPVSLVMNGARDVTASFVLGTGSIVAANTSSVFGLSTSNICEALIPVEIVRDGAENLREFTATIQLSNLALCNGVASIQEGTYLSSQGTTDFQVVDNPDGTFTVDGSIIGAPCGATEATGVLFTLDVTNTIPDGSGTIALTGLSLRDCELSPLEVVPGAPANIVIDSTPPTNVTGFLSTYSLTDNPAGNVTAINLVWSPSTDPTSVQTELYRKGFGSYPEFDDLGGTAPPAPSDPIAENWTLVGTLSLNDDSFSEVAPTRDYWFYCLTSTDAYGNESVGLVANGALNYLLGDVSDGGDPFNDGDNVVDAIDLDLLIECYGTSDGDTLYLDTLDIGPIDNIGTSGLPATDDLIDFEDLMLLVLNFGRDATAASWTPLDFDVPSPAFSNSVYLNSFDVAEVGQTFTVDIGMKADGQVMGLQIPLAWDENIINPVGIQSGPLLADQGGQSVVLSAVSGVIDVALVGLRLEGLSGAGDLAQVTFEVLDVGDPGLHIDGSVVGRGQVNNDVLVDILATSGEQDDGIPPRESVLLPNYPNPFNPQTTISFELATPGHVRISIYGLDGRLVRTLVDQPLTVGQHSRIWAGRDNRGRAVASGTYLYRLVGPEVEQTRRMSLIK